MIFINYRKADSQAVVDSLAKELKSWFGEARVFKDDHDIRAGDSWPKRLELEVLKSEVFLAIIGDKWLTIADDDGVPRIDDKDDWVRQEICTAFASNKRVIPLLVGSARMPTRTELPLELHELSNLQHLPLRPGPDFDGDVARLVKELNAKESWLRRFLYPVIVAILIAVVLLAYFGWFHLTGGRREKQEREKQERQVSSAPSKNLIVAGDQLKITVSPPLFAGAQGESSVIQVYVADNGDVTLPLLKKPLKLVGLKAAEASDSIANAYVEAQIFNKNRLHVFVERTP